MYECHVTINQREGESRDYIKHSVEATTGWKFSAIDGDPVLGDGVKCYATKHVPVVVGIVEVIVAVESVAGALREIGLDVIRTKVEFIVYDNKQ